MELFSEKGFHLTSIQEIADKSGIAKGSIYKHFSSKEELLLAVVEFYRDEMIKNTRELAIHSGLQPIDLLKKQINLQFDSFIKHKDLIRIQIMEQIGHGDEKVKSASYSFNKKILEWNKEQLLQAFGEEILPYIDDLVVIFKGILKEYLSICAFDGKKMDTESVVDFVVSRIVVIINDLLATKPDPILVDYFTDDLTAQESLNEERQVALILQQMKEIITEKDDSDIQGLVSRLEEELNKEIKNFAVVKAFLAHLKGIDQLNLLVDKMYKILNLSEYAEAN